MKYNIRVFSNICVVYMQSILTLIFYLYIITKIDIIYLNISKN